MSESSIAELSPYRCPGIPFRAPSCHLIRAVVLTGQTVDNNFDPLGARVSGPRLAQSFTELVPVGAVRLPPPGGSATVNTPTEEKL